MDRGQVPASAEAAGGLPEAKSAGAAPSLRERMVRGSLVSVAGFGAGQALRLASNLVLTRALYPEAFGVMTIVWSLLTGLEMLSDFGISAAIVRHERGDDRRFLNTAWTLGILRGLGLWAVASLLAYPAARFYDEPNLFQILPAAAGSVWIGSFASTNVLSARRHLQLGRLALMDIGAQLIGLAVMLPLAFLAPSVWVLVLGAVAAALGRTWLSHAVLPGERNRLHVDRDDARSLYHFGRLITLGSALQFLAKQTDRLMLGHLAGTAVLGVYGVGSYLAEALLQVGYKLSREVLFPALSSLSRERPHELQRSFYRARLRLDLLVQVPLGVLAGLGPWLIACMYDERYADAGWMFRLMCVGVGLQFASDTCQSCLVAMNRLQFQVWPVAARAAGALIGYPIGWYYGGLQGLLVAGVASELGPLVVLWTGLRRERLLRLSRECIAPLCFATAFFPTWLLLRWFA
jgi:O-antigen/teichoic acid export membrane protein